jgi:large subunit ribosomal protein L18
MLIKEKQEKRIRRHRRVRAKIKGTSDRPRFSVFVSNQHLYGQLIDDVNSRVLLSARDEELKKKARGAVAAKELGKLIAQKALDKKITRIVFDKAGYKYHGRVRALAEGAREGGLIF